MKNYYKYILNFFILSYFRSFFADIPIYGMKIEANL